MTKQSMSLDCFATLAMTMILRYVCVMLTDPDLKRLHWRAHHRGTKEADIMIGGFFNAHCGSWTPEERSAFADMLEEQDVDIMAWALGKGEPPARYADFLPSLRQLDYIKVAK